MVEHSVWHQCYADSWQGILLGPSYAHPAKFAKGLIYRIVEHALQEGFISPGQTMLDPFGGIAAGSLPSTLYGMHWIGCELEEKFVHLGRENIDAWKARFGHLPGYGKAVLLQGDSRQLAAILRAQADVVCSSPPYADNLALCREDGFAGGKGTRASGQPADRNKGDYHQPQAAGSLGNLPPGSVTAAIASPPYADGCTHTGGPDPQPQHVQGGEVRHVAYGTEPAQLGNMASGPVDIAVSSPPYETCVNSTSHGIDWSKAGPGTGNRKRGEGTKNEATLQAQLSYGSDADGQLGQTQGDTFWSAARIILEQVFSVLRPGGHAIFVTKRYCRDGAIVEFSQDWARLCQAVGFEWIHHHKAMLYEEHGTQTDLFGTDTKHTTLRMSFFRRLHTKKRPDLAILWEDVLCFRKPLAAVPLPPDEAWQQPSFDAAMGSPPYAEAIQNGHSGIDKTKGVDPRNPGSMSVRRLEEIAEGYGSTPGQLATLPPGQVQAVLSSPPYCHGLGKEHTYADEAKRDKDGHRRIMREKGIADPFYGRTDGNLGNLPEGSADCVISSPPYVHSVHDGNGIDQTKLTGNRPGKHTQAKAEGYGSMPGQLGSLPEGPKP